MLCKHKLRHDKPGHNLVCIHSARWTKEPSKTKITDFQYTFAVDQQIIWLQILQQYANKQYIKLAKRYSEKTN